MIRWNGKNWIPAGVKPVIGRRRGAPVPGRPKARWVAGWVGGLGEPACDFTYELLVTPTPTPTSSITPTATITPTLTPTPTPSSSAPSIDPDAAAYLADVIASGGTVDATMSAATDTLFTSLKNDGIYNKLFSFYPVIGGVSASHAINAKLNKSYDLTFNGGWTHNVSGMTSNGTNAYADTNVTPQDLGSAGTGLDNNHLLSSQSSISSVGGYEGAGPSPYMALRYGNIQWLNAQDDVSVGATYGTGVPAIQIGVRTSNTQLNAQWMVTGGTIGKKTENGPAATSITTNSIELGRISNTSFYDGGKLTNMWSVGDGLSDSEISDYFDAINTFNNSLSRRGW